MEEWKTFALAAAFVVAWIVLNRWVLPYFGVGTCMSNTCAVDPRPSVSSEHDSSEKPPEK